MATRGFILCLLSASSVAILSTVFLHGRNTTEVNLELVYPITQQVWPVWYNYHA